MIKFPVRKLSSDKKELWSHSGNLQIGDAVYITSSNTLDKADSSDPNKMPAIGIVSELRVGHTCKVQTIGYIKYSNLIPGELYYVGINGEIIQAASESLNSLTKQIIGRAKTASILQINLTPQIWQI